MIPHSNFALKKIVKGSLRLLKINLEYVVLVSGNSVPHAILKSIKEHVNNYRLILCSDNLITDNVQNVR